MRRSALPLTALLALAGPVLTGLAWLALGGAALIFLLVNGAALILAIAAALWLPIPERRSLVLACALAIVTLLAAPLVIGPEISSARRWLDLGPLRLHAGYLLLPLLVVLAARLPSLEASAVLLTSLAICLAFPDPATVLALAAALAALAFERRDVPTILALAASVIGAVWSFNQPDWLAPVALVEGVQSAAFAKHPAAGIAMTLSGFLPALLFCRPAPGARSLAAFMVLAAAAAFLGPYPAILIGYGASPILGFGLALAALRESAPAALTP